MLIRHFARQHYEHFVEINFATEPLAKAVFSGSLNAEAVITALSAYARRPLVPGETLIFLDEIQECPQARADIKFLVADGRFDYIESGFLLGAETKNGPSLPVGYETRLTMYPLDFAEFCTACGLQSVTFEYLKTCFETLQPVAESVHDSMLRLFYTYMVVGGMPQCVSTYLATHDIGQVLAVQNDILDRYRQDITRSGGRDMEKVLKTFEAIPFQLATKNRRFMLSEIAKTAWLCRATTSLGQQLRLRQTKSEISSSFSCATRVCSLQQACRTSSSTFCKAMSVSIKEASWKICLPSNCMPTVLPCATSRQKV